MIDEEKVRFALERFLKNPYWEKVYKDAPSEITKRHTALSFYGSIFREEIDNDSEMLDEYLWQLDRLEGEMNLNDWKYMYRHCGNNPLKSKFAERVRQLGGGDWLDGDGYRKDMEKFENTPTPRREGIYSRSAWDKTNFSDGYVLTFHQNLTSHNTYGGYTDETYALMCAITQEELGSKPLIAFYGHSETQFHCEDYRKSVEFSEQHNQNGLWNCKKDRCEVNPYHDDTTNPLIEE